MEEKSHKITCMYELKVFHKNISRAYNEDARSNIQALLLDTKKHLTFQGPNLIQDIDNLNEKPSS